MLLIILKRKRDGFEITNPTVKTLASGTKLIAKQMQANEGELMPAHLASIESILLIQEGECVFSMNGEDRVLKPGDAIIIPPETRHQISCLMILNLNSLLNFYLFRNDHFQRRDY